jgi:hypothetical protein
VEGKCGGKFYIQHLDGMKRHDVGVKLLILLNFWVIYPRLESSTHEPSAQEPAFGAAD